MPIPPIVLPRLPFGLLAVLVALPTAVVTLTPSGAAANPTFGGARCGPLDTSCVNGIAGRFRPGEGGYLRLTNAEEAALIHGAGPGESGPDDRLVADSPIPLAAPRNLVELDAAGKVSVENTKVITGGGEGMTLTKNSGSRKSGMNLRHALGGVMDAVEGFKQAYDAIKDGDVFGAASAGPRGA